MLEQALLRGATGNRRDLRRRRDRLHESGQRAADPTGADLESTDSPHPARHWFAERARAGRSSSRSWRSVIPPESSWQRRHRSMTRRVLLVLNDVTESRRVEAVRRDFVAAASHELKTPIAAVLASVEALTMALERDPAAAESFASQIESSARQLGRLVSDLLDLSRLEAQRTSQEEVVWTTWSKRSWRACRIGASRRNRVPAKSSVTVNGSRSDLGLAVRNLFDNALRHTPRGGKVRVEVASDGQGVKLEVIDTGEGISSRDLPRVFERFFRVDSARSRATGGTGLGLAIVRHVAESHGGSVEAESELGAGSTFRIRLRCTRPDRPRRRPTSVKP